MTWKRSCRRPKPRPRRPKERLNACSRWFNRLRKNRLSKTSLSRSSKRNKRNSRLPRPLRQEDRCCHLEVDQEAGVKVEEEVEDEVEVEEDPQVWAGVVREERLLL